VTTKNRFGVVMPVETRPAPRLAASRGVEPTLLEREAAERERAWIVAQLRRRASVLALDPEASAALHDFADWLERGNSNAAGRKAG
jgi:hypothetical protein